MRIEKALLLASMAAVAVALAVPVGGSAIAAQTITDKGSPLSNHTILFTGTYKFSALGSGFECANVNLPVTVNGDSIEVEGLSIVNPTTECTWFGSPYVNCEFEKHPQSNISSSDGLVLDLQEDESLTVTKKTSGEIARINSEVKSRIGKVCPFTTTDIRIMHEASSSLLLDIETKNGFIDALQLTGTAKVDTGGPGSGTTVTTTTPAAITGTLHIDKTKTETYSVG